ncbi:MAG: GNAT family N-acetyltransferase [Cyclobacteriaceae bacterium]|nr:GNAT family N-acetyltransferase [Cyclobacteriaceae bacterium]
MVRTGGEKKSVVVDILAASFDDNKSVNYVVKQDARRKERVRGLMEYSYNVCNAFGEVWVSDDEQACALILLPDCKRTNLDAILRDVKLATSVIGLSRVGQVLSRESKIKAFHPKEPFSYLWFVGVRPEVQGRGKGSQLLNEVIKGQDSRPIYLETSVEKNLSWYKKHGFEIFNTLDFTYTLYMMRRVKGSL